MILKIVSIVRTAPFGLGVALGLAVLGARAEWPTARGDAGRSAASAVGPKGALFAAWAVETGVPRPAWAAEARGSLWQKIDRPLVARAADDLAPVPVVAEGVVVFGTTSDEVRCVDRDTGRTRWRRFCGGPVRFAPAISGGRVFVGSDDGRVQALDLRDGQVIWSVVPGPDQPWISGNGRLISPHPIRTGLLVSGGIVYATAGLFPLEGTYLVALDGSDGRLRWRRQLGNVSPQGYLVDAGADLIVPNGRAEPRLHRKSDGTFRRELSRSTGTLAVVSGDESFSGPGATGSMARGELRAGAKMVSFPGRQLAVTPTTSLLLNDREVLALDRSAMRAAGGDPGGAVIWRCAVNGGNAVIVAGRRVYVGTGHEVVAIGLDSGVVDQSLPVEAPVVALAADSALLVASLADGRIRAFRTAGSTGIAPSDAIARPAGSTAPPVLPKGVAEGLAGLPSGVGWGLSLASPRAVAGASQSRAALVQGSSLRWVFAVEASEADAVRSELSDRGWLGSRASVVVRRSGAPLPVADHLFNLVLADGRDRSEALRLTCPGPSGVLVIDGRAATVAPDPTAGAWTHQYGTPGNSCATTQSMRGAPRLRWFGGHGPERLPDRHTRGHAPLAAGGLVVSVAEDGLIGTDARNGTLRWSIALPEAMRYAMPYDGGYLVLADDGSRVWAAVDAELWEADTRAGSVVRKRPHPIQGRHWGWVARSDGVLLASSIFPGAPRSLKGYELVDLEYRSRRPMVCSKALLRPSEAGEGVDWSVPTEGAWVNATLCAEAGRVYGVEARGAKARADRTGRLTCADLLEDAAVVCLDAADGRRIWERPLRWPEAEDILGLSISGGRLFLSCARSAGSQAAYHLRCWRASDGTKSWAASGLNPVHDLYHGQQVKRPVVMPDMVCFESEVFAVDTGKPWRPAGDSDGWILKRPGHACGGMTGTGDGLLFRADNPTLFRFSDGSFTRLAPTRPGCWLNILPVEGGVVIPEASASCICGYPIQASMGFAFGPAPAPVLADVLPGR